MDHTPTTVGWQSATEEREMKKYLGDGVYVEIDSCGSIVLTTENGIAETNRIVLEYDVLKSFEDYLCKALEKI